MRRGEEKEGAERRREGRKGEGKMGGEDTEKDRREEKRTGGEGRGEKGFTYMATVGPF